MEAKSRLLSQQRYIDTLLPAPDAALGSTTMYSGSEVIWNKQITVLPRLVRSPRLVRLSV